MYEQEPILLTYKVYTLVDLTSLDGKMPDLTGFHTQEIPLPTQKSFHVEKVNGRNYRCVTWSQYVMYPQMTGKLKIPSITFKGIVVQRYRRHFDARTGFMRGVNSNGTFTEPFDPAFSLHEEADYVEGNAWQYSFLVPHDVDGLAQLYGGCKQLVYKLDDLFAADSALNEGASADITGMIGQYAHGNEPSHHTIYLYSLLGRTFNIMSLKPNLSSLHKIILRIR